MIKLTLFKVCLQLHRTLLLVWLSDILLVRYSTFLPTIKTMRAGTLQVRQHRISASQVIQGRNGDEGSLRGCQTAAYRDFALVSSDSILKIVEPPKAKRKGPRGGVQTPFPVRLFDMLEAAHKEGLENIVSWQPHGRSFIVRKSGQFEARLLPR